jgi:spore coat protein U domain-containing protein, fimbrial subunit CupE1/2/3/6
LGHLIPAPYRGRAIITRYSLVVLVLLTHCGKFAVAQTQAHCSAVIGNVIFGSYTGSTIRATASLLLSCNGGSATFAIALNSGTTPGATVTNRSMSSASGRLNYELFSDPAYSLNWGNTPGTGWVTSTENGTDRIFTIYAQVPGNQLPPRDRYSDVITATIIQLSGSNFPTVTARFTVAATVVGACSLSATDLAFGAYSGSLTNSTSSISVNCVNGTPYDVGLNAGNGPGATVTNRSMTGRGAAQLHYKLSRDPAHTFNWGNTVGTDTVAGTGTGTTQSLAVYGQLPANQSVPSGNYSDTIVVTVTF